MNSRDSEIAFAQSVPLRHSNPKARKRGLTEIRDRGMGMNQVRDLVTMLGDYIDIFKAANGSQRLLRREVLREKNEYLASNGIEVSTGGLLERVVLEGSAAVLSFLDESKELGFSVVEVSNGIISMSLRERVELVKVIEAKGMKAKPEIGLAYGIQEGDEVEASVDKVIYEGKALLEAGAWKLMIEEEGIFENVATWQTDHAHKIVSSFGLDKLMFEASDVHVFNWFLLTYGPEVNLFVDPTQVSELATARTGVWGKKDLWGRVAGFTAPGN